MSSPGIPQDATLFPLCFDPRGQFHPEDLVALTHLQLLLSSELCVQDNFLVSRLFYDLNTEVRPNLVPDLIERGWLRVALRDGQYSLSSLRRDLLASAVAGTYTPFEELDEGVVLYRDSTFKNYVKTVDSHLATDRAVLPWNPAALGRRLRTLLRASAIAGRAGLSPDSAMAVWHAVDERSEGRGHTRTGYFKYASSLSDRKQAQKIRSWVSVDYLRNLPDALSLDLSVPRPLLRSIDAWDPLSELGKLGSQDESATLFGRDCVLLHRRFLLGLDLSDVEKLRSLPEFSRLIEARAVGDATRIGTALRVFLRAVGEEAGAVYGPYRDDVRRLRARVRIKKWTTTAAEVGGAIAGVSSVVTAGAAGPWAAAALGILSIALSGFRRPELDLRELEEEARADLASTALSSTPIQLGEFCHGRDERDTS